MSVVQPPALQVFPNYYDKLLHRWQQKQEGTYHSQYKKHAYKPY